MFLYNNDLDDDMMLEFSQMISNKGKLVTLGLEYNRVRSRGANHVFNAVKFLPRFERLFFSHNLLSDESGDSIQALMKDSKSLKEIRLSDNP